MKPEPLNRRDIEAECLCTFERVLNDLGLEVNGRGYGANNRFDPGFNLVGQQRFQYGDLRVVLEDRIVVVEVESAGGLTNLVKYWPLVQSSTKPILLLHAFGQCSANDYLSHLRLWDFIWARMRSELWACAPPAMYAQRFQHVHDDPTGLQAVALAFRRCLTEPLPVVCREVFGYTARHTGLQSPNV